MGFGPFDLGAQPNEIVQDNLLASIPYVLLTLFLVGSSYFQQWQITRRRNTDGSTDSPQMQMQQTMMRILPLMSGIWGFFFPTGLVLYWATSNLFRIGQQEYIGRRYYGDEGAGTKAMAALEETRLAEAEAKKQAKKGKKKPVDKSETSDKSDDAPSDDGVSDDGVSDETVDDRQSANGASTNGSSSRNDGKVDRNAEWAEMRARRAKTKARAQKANASKSSTGGGPSSRVTPKGTKPVPAKKKRKR